MIIIPPIEFADGGHTRASHATQWGKVGDDLVLQEVGNDVLRLSYDPAEPDLPALPLIEPEAAINLFRYPRDLSAVGWATINATIRPNVALSPSGVMDADILLDNTTNGSHVAYQSVVPTDRNIVFSEFVKSAGLSQFRLSSFESVTPANPILADFDLVAGTATVSGGGTVEATIEPVFDGWYHCIARTTSAALVSTTWSLALRKNGAINYTGDGLSGLYLWHAQLEEGDKASSIIPDNTAFVSRAGGKWEFNSAVPSVLTQYAADVAVTAYDPVTNLSRGLSLEPAVTNGIRNNTMVGAAVGAFIGAPGTLPTNWFDVMPSGISRSVVGFGSEDGIEYIDLRYFGTASSSGDWAIFFESSSVILAAQSQTWTGSMYRRLMAGSYQGFSAETIVLLEYDSGGTGLTAGATPIPRATTDKLSWQRISGTRTLTDAATARLNVYLLATINSGFSIDLTIRVGLPCLVRNSWACSPIKTSGSAVTRAADISTSTPATRAADVISETAGLLYSNVPVTEPLWSAVTSYALDDTARDPASPRNVYRSLVGPNLNQPLTDATKWQLVGVANRWKMFDQYNNTQTVYPDEIVMVFNPGQIAQGLYLGNMIADSTSVSLTTIDDGEVYSDEQDTLTYGGGSSYWDWSFGPINRKSYYLTAEMPPYYGGLVTLRIRNTDADVAVGMCVLGGLVDVGISLTGLSNEIKDYSSTIFNFDGTSSTTVRGYAKIMSLELLVNNDSIDSAIEMMADYRQRNVVWVGDTGRGATIAYGKYSNFRNVIEYQNYSLMSLTIQGTV